MAFRHDVGDAHHFEYCAHGTTCNDAGTLRCGNHHHVGSAVATVYSVVDRAVLQRHFHHVAAGFFHRLLHSCRHFFRFAFGLIFLFIVGAGSWSIDAKLAGKKEK